MIDIRWTQEAATDLDQINSYLREHYSAIAQITISKIYAAVVSLKRMPHRGRRGRMAETRELVLAPLPYIVVYRVSRDIIEILHIHHGSQDWR